MSDDPSRDVERWLNQKPVDLNSIDNKLDMLCVWVDEIKDGLKWLTFLVIAIFGMVIYIVFFR